MITGNLLAKLSILLLFRQLFAVGRRSRIAIWIGSVAVVLVFVPTFTYQFIIMVPRPGMTWDDVFLSGQSGANVPFWPVVSSALHLMLDLYIVLLPLPIIAKLNWSTKQKLKAALVFSTAIW